MSIKLSGIGPPVCDPAVLYFLIAIGDALRPHIEQRDVSQQESPHGLVPLSCALAPSPSRHFDCCFCLSVVNYTTEIFVVCLKNKGRKVARVEVRKSFVYRMGPGPLVCSD